MAIGPHVQLAYQLTQAGWDWCMRAPIVKSVDYAAPLTVARSDAITIFRAYVENQDSITPEDFLSLTVARLSGFRPTYIEGLNEHKARIEYGLRDYIDWTAEFTRLAHGAGYKVAGFSFPTGNPDSEDWFLIRDQHFSGVDALSIHAYWGHPGPLLSEWNALRHRIVHQWLNGQHPPMIITECGRDAIEQEGAAGQRGWKLQGITDETYIAELLEFGAAVAEDDYVLGAIVFTVAPNDEWRNFNVDNLAAYMPGEFEAPTNGGDMQVTEMDAKINQLLDQNRIITQALIDFRHGRFTGADGIDGRIVELLGGKLPEGWNPTYPKA